LVSLMLGTTEHAFERTFAHTAWRVRVRTSEGGAEPTLVSSPPADAPRNASMNAPSDAPLLRVTNLRRAPRVRDVSLDVRAGEIVGLTGLLGSGRSETARVLFGADAADGGTIMLNGTAFTPTHPRDAIARGVAFVSEDRTAEGIIPELSVRENLTLAALPTLTRFGIVDRARQRTIVDSFMRNLGIKASSADQRMRELSGGNQQKVLLARWLCTHPKLLIVDEPTRGIDLGARADVQRVVRALAAEGLGVLMISSDLQEVIDESTRVVVLRDGQQVATLEPDTITPDAIVQAMAMDDDRAPLAVETNATEVDSHG